MSTLAGILISVNSHAQVSFWFRFAAAQLRLRRACCVHLPFARQQQQHKEKAPRSAVLPAVFVKVAAGVATAAATVVVIYFFLVVI